MSERCTRHGSYIERSRLRLCTMIDSHTAYDPDENVERCRQCGMRTLQCHTCSGRVHSMEPQCPYCGADMRQRWRLATKTSTVA